MSEEQLKAFIAKVQGDPSLQKQLQADGSDAIEIAKAAGFFFTVDDLKGSLEIDDEELSSAELESVAGGNLFRLRRGGVASTGANCTCGSTGCHTSVGDFKSYWGFNKQSRNANPGMLRG